MKSEYKRVVTQASAEMLARWILKNLDWSGGNDDANATFLTSILLEHRKQATAAPEAHALEKQFISCVRALVNGGVFDLTDSPKSLVGNLQKLIAELDASLTPQRVQEPERCPECGHGNRLNGRIVHGPTCSNAARMPVSEEKK